MTLPTVPNVFWAREIHEWPLTATGKLGIPVLARPMGFSGLCLRRRLYLAWMVFTGKYDVLRWTDAL